MIKDQIEAAPHTLRNQKEEGAAKYIQLVPVPGTFTSRWPASSPGHVSGGKWNWQLTNGSWLRGPPPGLQAFCSFQIKIKQYWWSQMLVSHLGSSIFLSLGCTVLPLFDPSLPALRNRDEDVSQTGAALRLLPVILSPWNVWSKFYLK